jgi:tRNA-(ms[2]io[6]A)-hydroxylase
MTPPIVLPAESEPKRTGTICRIIGTGYAVSERGNRAAIGPVLQFLACRTPTAWLEGAIAEISTLLLDHAALELKAAQQAQKLIWKYGASPEPCEPRFGAAFRLRLVNRMSRLAREELRHFEQVVALLERRGSAFRRVSPARYAGELHALARGSEPDALVDSLLIGAVIEARSCERFFSLLEPLAQVDAELAAFYASLLRAESRHFEDYLELARMAAGEDTRGRIDSLLQREAELVWRPEREVRFLSGPPAPTPRLL